MSDTPENRPYGQGDASYQAAGQYEGICQLVNAFYDAMEQLPQAQVIRAMHAEDLTVSRDKLSRFLCGWLGGPKLFTERYPAIRIPQVHRHLDIGPQERDAWLHCMQVAVDQQPYKDDFKRYLMEQLYVPAERSRNRD